MGNSKSCSASESGNGRSKFLTRRLHKINYTLGYIAHHPEIKEVILTGGDPLALSDARLAVILNSLNDIKHLEYLRIHTRMPTAVPSRISESLLGILGDSRLPVWLVLHINHADELTERARAALNRLARRGIPLLSQSVLMRGVNDSVDALTNLARSLVRERVKPYYLHYLDLAQGTNHFRLPLEEAIDLVGELRGRLSGFAIPQFIVDLPGGHGKVALERIRYRQVSPDSWIFTSPLSGAEIQVCYPSFKEEKFL